MTRALHRLLLGGGLVLATGALAGTGALAQAARFDTHDNDKHGFSLTYPKDTFVALPISTPDGFQAVSRDGNARLLVGTIANFDGKSLADYRAFLLNAAYPGAKIDYAPVRQTWFVISGVRKDGATAFYQRVNFVCGGRNINSWAVIFPAGQEPVYSKIIDQIHRDYAVGDGNCNKTAMMAPPAVSPKQMSAPMGTNAPAMQAKPMGDMERIMTGAMEPTMPPRQAVAMASQMPPKDMGNAAMAAGVTTYTSDKHGFSLTYPTGQFLALPQATPDLFQAVSKDGKARLQAGTIANFDGKSLGGYRDFLLSAAYPGAKLGDAPMLAKGFVVTGVQSDGATAFYHRVSFLCGWRSITSWSLQYPAADQATYAKVIEQVDRGYDVGDGNCDKATMMEPMQPTAMGAVGGMAGRK
jgi:hypothetical protein